MRLKTTLLSLFVSTIVSASPINTIVAFGDSLTDNGNAYEYLDHLLPQSPPYYNGRFSNGPVWVEWLAQDIFPKDSNSHLLDYAFGGAGVSMDKNDDVLFSLYHEIEVYALAHDNKASPDSLYVVWIGANNYLALPEDNEEALHDVIGGINDGLQRLLGMGAKNILVINLPDLGRTPYARDYSVSEQLTTLSLRHNQDLGRLVQQLKQDHSDVNWFFYDIHGSLDNVFESPADYGIRNTSDTCYDVQVDKPSQKLVLHMAAKHGKRDMNDDCAGYLFFDPVHVTSVMHRIVAEQVLGLLRRNGTTFQGERSATNL